MEFRGWPPQALDWFDGLAADNSKAWFHANRRVYDEAVRGPMEDLVDDLTPEFGEMRVSRPNRDIRFSKDKAPYKLEIYARTRRPDGSGHYVRLSREGLFVGAGLYMPDRDRLARVRAAIADDTSGGELEVILAALGAAGLALLTDGGLKTAPRGYSADHPRIDLLRLPHLAAGTEFAPRKWLHTPAAEGRIVAALRGLDPLLDWLAATA